MHRKNRIVAIVQARFYSTRLHGKVLMPISGKSVLWHVVNRLRYSKLAEKVVIATTTNQKDCAIVQFCKQNNIDCFTGKEHDVLDRYYQTARKYRADVVVRITGDCPMIDPQLLDKVIGCCIRAKDADFACNIAKRSYPRGLDTEVFSFKVLEKVWEEAKEPYQREHVTPYVYEHPESFHIVNIENPENFSYMRWTVDEEEDLEFVREIYKRLYKKEKIFLLKDVLNLLEKEPQLLQINKKIVQKVSAEMARSMVQKTKPVQTNKGIRIKRADFLS